MSITILILIGIITIVGCIKILKQISNIKE